MFYPGLEEVIVAVVGVVVIVIVAVGVGTVVVAVIIALDVNDPEHRYQVALLSCLRCVHVFLNWSS